MRILVGVLGGVIVVLMLFEIFLAFLLPRRVKRDPRLARRVAIYLYRPWRWVARRLPDQAGDTLLGMYGPFALLLDLALWVRRADARLRLPAVGRPLARSAWPDGDFGAALYFSAATFVSSGTGGLHSRRHLRARHPGARRGERPRRADDRDRLPAVPLPGLLAPRDDRLAARRARRLAALGGPARRARRRRAAAGRRSTSYLRGWEEWSAELMETHLSYPQLAFFRSQHVNQNWLSALCTILDASALAVAAAPKGTVDGGALHLRDQPPRRRRPLLHLPRQAGRPLDPDRLPPADFDALLGDAARERRRVRRRAGRDPRRSSSACASSTSPTSRRSPRHVELRLPPWLAPEDPTDNWRTTAWH